MTPETAAWFEALLQRHGLAAAVRAARLRAIGREAVTVGAHEFQGPFPSRAGRRQSKLGPGIISAARLEALLAGRTCDCLAFGMLHRPEQCRPDGGLRPPTSPEGDRSHPWGIWRHDPHDDGEGGEA